MQHRRAMVRFGLAALAVAIAGRSASAEQLHRLERGLAGLRPDYLTSAELVLADLACEAIKGNMTDELGLKIHQALRRALVDAAAGRTAPTEPSGPGYYWQTGPLA